MNVYMKESRSVKHTSKPQLTYQPRLLLLILSHLLFHIELSCAFSTYDRLFLTVDHWNFMLISIFQNDTIQFTLINFQKQNVQGMHLTMHPQINRKNTIPDLITTTSLQTTLTWSFYILVKALPPQAPIKPYFFFTSKGAKK